MNNPTHFSIDKHLLADARASLSKREKLYWIVGGAGAGKTTICRAISAQNNIELYDMDAHIYGAYHGRFSPQKHPVNYAWSTAGSGLQWLLDMTWEEFNNFNQAAIAEYLNLLAEDLDLIPANECVLVDGGICNPAQIAKVIPTHQIVCLAVSERPSAEIWEANDERLAMKDAIFQLPDPEQLWRKFLEFDSQITRTILAESYENNIPVCTRRDQETIEEFALKVAQAVHIQQC